VLSIGLDGMVCHAPLVLPWVKRSPAFILKPIETEQFYVERMPSKISIKVNLTTIKGCKVGLEDRVLEFSDGADLSSLEQYVHNRYTT
jgi:hypothetical protein